MIPVVHLITSLDVGGAQRMLVKLLGAMDRDRFPSRVVSLVEGGAMAEDLAKVGIEVTSLGMRPGTPDPRALFRLREMLARWRPSVLQTWLYHADLLGAFVGRWARVPRTVWNVRCSDQVTERGRARRRLLLWSCARLSRRPDAIVVNSRAGRAFHEGRGYRPRRWEWIPNGFDVPADPDPSERSAVREELGLPADGPVALCVARWHPSKDVPNLLRAVAHAPADVHFVCAGDGLDASNPAWSALADGPAAARIHGLGVRRDVPRLLAAADFLVSPSRFEGFPNVLGEALAAGVPCVATDAGDSAALVEGAGFVVPPADPAALGEAITRMVGMERAARESLGQAGRARIAAEFSLSRIAERYEELYRSLTGGLPCAA